MTKHRFIMQRTLHSCFWFSQLTSEMSVTISLCSTVLNASGLITRSFMSHFILLPRQRIRICFSWTQNLIFLVTFILHLHFIRKDYVGDTIPQTHERKSASSLKLWIYSLCVHSFIHFLCVYNMQGVILESN